MGHLGSTALNIYFGIFCLLVLGVICTTVGLALSQGVVAKIAGALGIARSLVAILAGFSMFFGRATRHFDPDLIFAAAAATMERDRYRLVDYILITAGFAGVIANTTLLVLRRRSSDNEESYPTKNARDRQADGR